MKLRNLILSLGLLAGIFVLHTVVNPTHAAAAATWCDVMADPAYPTGNPGTDAHCLSGQKEHALDGINTKSELESYIRSYGKNSQGGQRGGYGFQKIGIAYIINGICGGDSACLKGTGGDGWAQRIDNPGIEVSIGQNPYCVNTAYDTSSNSVVQYSDGCAYQGQTTLFLKNSKTGTIYYAIKIDCGNPVGNLPGLPPPPPPANNLPKGSITFACQANGTLNLTYTFSDADGTKGATLAWVYLGTATPSTTSPSGGKGEFKPGVVIGHAGWSGYATSPTTVNIPASKVIDGTNSAWLYVKDVGASGDGNYHYEDMQPGLKCTQPKLPPPNAAPCPGDPGYADIGRITLSTPYENPNTTTAPSGLTSNYGTVKYQDKNVSNVSFQILDTSVGGASLSNQLKFVTPPTPTSTTVTINPAPFRATYPYDLNNAKVSYKTNYDTVTWKADVFNRWSCDGGGTYKGGSGTGACGTYSVDDGNECPGYYGGMPNRSGHTDGTCFYDNGSSSANCTASGGVYYGDFCGITYNIGYCAYYDTYTVVATSPHTQVDCLHQQNYPNPTAYYSYENLGTQSGLSTQTQYSSEYKMGACFPREYKVTTSASGGVYQTSDENPVSAIFNYSVNVAFMQPTDLFAQAPNTALRVSTPMTPNPTYTPDSSNLGSCSGGGSPPVYGSALVTNSGTNLQPTCTVINQPLVIGDVECLAMSIEPAQAYLYVNNTNVTVAASYGVTPSVSSCTNPVRNEPYLKVFGGDVAAGIDFTNASNCSANSGAQIKTFNTGTNPYNGSGTDLAALALDSIDQFVSAQGSATNPLAPKGLTFANTVAQAYGGKMGGNPGCSADYYSGAGGATGSPPSSLSGLTPGDYVFNATQPITSLSGTIGKGVHVIVYSSYNVYIDGPINFSAVPITDVNDLPSFSLIVKNAGIYVGNNVMSLNGNYIAQGGRIDDCAPSAPAGLAAQSSYGSGTFDNCSNKLTVHGSFIADNIDFYRMGEQGSLRYSTNDSRDSNNASEEFDYSPITWLAQPPNDNKPPKYDAITSLPPVL